MTDIDPRITAMILDHHVLTLAVSSGNNPYCASCFYIYMEEQNLFVFTSDHETRHIRDVVEGENYRVAGAIALETKMVGKIRGIQFTGQLRELKGKERETAKRAYLAKFPIARFAKLHLWGVEPDLLKMTDNRLGFGKKLTWKQHQGNAMSGQE
jgi:uncharacterized protein